MAKSIIRNLIFLTLFVISYSLKGQVNDTVRIRFNQLLMLQDTIYYGIHDSIVILESGTEYDLLKNILVRRPEYYKKKPEKLESVKKLHNKYAGLLMGQIQNRKETLPEDFNPADNYYKFYEDRIVKEIVFEGVAVLDGNAFDTTRVKSTAFGRFLNSTYQPTRQRVIRNNLKFKKGDRINPRIFSDNERLLRNLPYIEDASIKIIPTKNSGDSATILIVTKDKYPIGIDGDIKDYNYFEVEPYTRNFLGLGHNLGLIMQFKGGEDQIFGYGGYYGIDNILGTFIASELSYRNNYRSEFFRTRWEKPFVTTNTKFGGEIMYENLAENRLPIYNYPDSIFANDEFYRINVFDTWLGYSIVNKDLTKPFINIAGRFYLGNYTTRPEIDPETNYPFHDRNLYLASVSLQKINYIKTSKLLQFGIIEDVPIGINMNLTSGWEKTSFYERPYFGIMLNYSKYFQNAGIFSSQTEIGGYRCDSDFEDVFAGIKFNYFSPLSNFGRFELRNILETSYISVLNRRYLFPVHFGEGKRGLDRLEIFGETALEFRYRSVFYTPYKVGGFKFSIGPFVDMGWITRMESFQGDKEFFAVYGITTSTKNESLIFPAMHLHLGYSPNWIGAEYKIEFKIVFKDYKIFNKFTSLQPKTANPTNFY